jgi:drug/metabolite transporter (DMT)-like permease
MSDQFRGILLVLASYSLLAVEAIVVHRLGSEVGVLQLTLLRSLGGLVLVLMLCGRRSWMVFRTHSLWLQGVRGGLTVASMWALFYAFSVLPLTEAMAVTYTGSAFLTVLAIAILGERVSAARLGALVVGMVGVVVVLRPDFSAWRTGYLYAIGAMILYAGSIVTTKVLERRDSPVTVLAYVNLITFLVSSPSFTLPLPIGLWPWLIAAAVVGPIALYCNLLAVRHADVSTLAPFDYVRLVIAVGAAYLLFDEQPTGGVLVGSALILAGCVLIAITARRFAPAEQPAG